jgi:hypothetical protein
MKCYRLGWPEQHFDCQARRTSAIRRPSSEVASIRDRSLQLYGFRVVGMAAIHITYADLPGSHGVCGLRMRN